MGEKGSQADKAVGPECVKMAQSCPDKSLLELPSLLLMPGKQRIYAVPVELPSGIPREILILFPTNYPQTSPKFTTRPRVACSLVDSEGFIMNMKAQREWNPKRPASARRILELLTAYFYDHPPRPNPRPGEDIFLPKPPPKRRSPSFGARQKTSTAAAAAQATKTLQPGRRSQTHSAETVARTLQSTPQVRLRSPQARQRSPSERSLGTRRSSPLDSRRAAAVLVARLTDDRIIQNLLVDDEAFEAWFHTLVEVEATEAELRGLRIQTRAVAEGAADLRRRLGAESSALDEFQQVLQDQEAQLAAVLRDQFQLTGPLLPSQVPGYVQQIADDMKDRCRELVELCSQGRLSYDGFAQQYPEARRIYHLAALYARRLGQLQATAPPSA